MKKCGCNKEMPKYMHEEHMMEDCCMPMHEGHMHMMQHMHGGHMMPGMNRMMLAMMSLEYFQMHACPITEHACMQVKKEGVECAIEEAALLGLLIGMGYNHEKAHMVVDNWKNVDKCGRNE